MTLERDEIDAAIASSIPMRKKKGGTNKRKKIKRKRKTKRVRRRGRTKKIKRRTRRL